MNPLTKAATQNTERENAIIAWTTGIIMTALVIAFFL